MASCFAEAMINFRRDKDEVCYPDLEIQGIISVAG